jgi:uncharacterized protein (TIGR02246 family)
MMHLSGSDRREIDQLIARLFQNLDLQDPEGYASIFTVNGIFSMPFGDRAGRGDIAAFLRERMEAGMTTGVRYFVSNGIVAEAEDGARYRCYVMQVKTDSGPSIVGTGSFDAHVTKHDGKWLFRHLRLNIDRAQRK